MVVQVWSGHKGPQATNYEEKKTIVKLKALIMWICAKATTNMVFTCDSQL